MDNKEENIIEKKDYGKKRSTIWSKLFKAIKLHIKAFYYLFVFILVITTITAVLLKNERVQEYVKKRVQSTVENKLKLKIDFSDFSLSFIPISFNLNNVDITPVIKEGVTSNIQIKQIRLRTGIRPVKAIKHVFGYSKEDIKINRIQLIGLNANLYLKDGKLSIPTAYLSGENAGDTVDKEIKQHDGKKVKEDTAKPVEKEAKAPAEKPKEIIIREVEIRNSNISLKNLDDDSGISINGLNMLLGTENIKERITCFSKLASVNIKKGKIDEKFRDIFFDGVYSFKKNDLWLKKVLIFKGKKSEVELSGNLLVKPKFEYAINLDLIAEGDEIKKFLPKKFKFEGDYKFSGKVSGTKESFDVSGKTSSKRGNIYGIAFESLMVDTNIDNDGVIIKNLKGKMFGGEVTGSYSMPFDTVPDFKASLSLKKTTIDGFEKSCPALPSLLSGEINGTVKAEGRFKDGYFIDVNADLTSPKFTLYKELYAPAGKNEERFIFNNMKLKMALDVSKRGLYFSDLSLVTDDFSLDVKGSMPKYTNLMLDFNADIRELGVIKIPAGLEKELFGAATIKGSLREKASDPSISLDINVINVLFDDILVDRIRGGIGYKNKSVSFSAISAQKGGYDLTLNGGIDLKDKVSLDIDASINSADLSELNRTLEELKVKRVEALDNITGKYKGRIQLSGSVNDPDIRFDVSSERLNLYKNDIALDIKGTATKKSVSIKEAFLKRDNIRLGVKGVIDYKDGPDLYYTTKSVYLEEIFTILKKNIDLDAKLVSTGRIFGKFDDIKIASNISLSEVLFMGQTLKDSNFDLSYSKEGISVTGGFFNEEVTLDLMIGGEKLNEIALRSSLKGFKLDPILAAIVRGKNIKCTVDGELGIDTVFDYENLSDIHSHFRNTKSFKADIKLSDLSTDKYKLEESLVNLVYENNAGSVKLKMLKDKVDFMSYFDYDGDLQTKNGIHIKNLKVSDIKSYIKETEGLEGTVNLDLDFKLKDLLSTKRAREYISKIRDINGSINITDIFYNLTPLNEFCLNLSTKKDVLRLDGFCHDSLIRIDGKVNYSGKKDYKINIATSSIIDYPEFLKKLNIYHLPAGIDGKTKLKFLVTGKIDDFEQFSVNISSDLFTLKTSGLEFKNDGDIDITLLNDTLFVRSFTIKDGNSSFSLTGTVEKMKKLDLKVEGDINLLLIKPFLKEKIKRIERFEGTSSVTVTIKGETKSPEILGSFRLKEGLISIDGFPENLESITGRGTFSEKAVSIENITVVINKTPVVISGDITMRKDEPLMFNLAADYEKLNLTYPEYVETDTTGNLKLEGPVNDLALTGTVNLIKLAYTQPIKLFTIDDFKNFFKRFKKRKTEPVRKEKKKIGLKFDVAINAEEEESIRIDNNLVKCELKGHLNLIGDVSNVVVIGNLEITSGRILTYFEDFEFTSGIINFSNESYIQPEFDITAEKEIESITSDITYPVTINFSGNSEEPVVTFSSPAGYSSDELIKLVTLGIEPKKSEEETREMATAGIYKIVSDQISEELSSQFGGPQVFDKFTIVPYYSESSATTSAQLAVGKDLTDDLTLEYTTDITGTGEQNAELEYEINNNISIVGDWNNRGESSGGSLGGDIRFKFEFR